MTLDEFFGHLKVYRPTWNIAFSGKIRTSIDGGVECCPITYLYWKETGRRAYLSEFRDAGKALGLSESDAVRLQRTIDDRISDEYFDPTLRHKLLSDVVSNGDVNDH